MRPYLCWNCGRLCKCEKTFLEGRPKKRSECADYTKAAADPPRITHREMANLLGFSIRKIEQLVASAKGVRYLTKALAHRGVAVTYERVKNRLYFYREEEKIDDK